jgi:hypothetical protein
MSKIEIRTNGSVGTIEVDGVALPHVTGYRIEHAVSGLPTVTVDLLALEQTTHIGEGVLKIGTLQASEALERAMLAYLEAKYHPLEITGMDDTVRRFAKVTPIDRT